MATKMMVPKFLKPTDKSITESQRKNAIAAFKMENGSAYYGIVFGVRDEFDYQIYERFVADGKDENGKERIRVEAYSFKVAADESTAQLIAVNGRGSVLARAAISLKENDFVTAVKEETAAERESRRAEREAKQAAKAAKQAAADKAAKEAAKRNGKPAVVKVQTARVPVNQIPGGKKKPAAPAKPAKNGKPKRGGKK